jgi:hypothetical protein
VVARAKREKVTLVERHEPGDEANRRLPRLFCGLIGYKLSAFSGRSRDRIRLEAPRRLGL